MKLLAPLIIVVLAVGLPWPVAAVTREELVCPVREDWSAETWEQWENEQRENQYKWSGACPCEARWKPTEELLQEILTTHENWIAKKGSDNPVIVGQAVLCNAYLEKANLREANLSFANLQGADLWGANLQEAFLRDTNLQEAHLWNAYLQQAYLRGANLQQADLGLAYLQQADLWGANLQEAFLRDTKLQEAHLWNANLQEADLMDANLQEANLRLAYLQQAYLRGANLQKADLQGAKLQEADLQGANLQEADLQGANLQEANLRGADIEDARIANTNLTGTIYAPASPPPHRYVEGITGLSSVVIPYEEATRTTQTSGMVQLRELFHEAELRERERQATFAIEHHKSLHAREHGSASEWLGGWLRLIFFEGTTGWGLYPGRALAIMLALMGGFGFLYAIAIWDPPIEWAQHGEVVRILPAERLVDREGVRQLAGSVTAEPVATSGLAAALGWGLYFSMLSAFHIGWRDLNVGTWISRIQPTEFALRGRGWVRMVSGVQSLISVYLVAMWVLTYFGRPFQ